MYLKIHTCMNFILEKSEETWLGQNLTNALITRFSGQFTGITTNFEVLEYGMQMS